MSELRLAFVIPWYGDNIPGGAEAECRRAAEHLHQSGVNVEVLTTCVREFASDWNRDFHKPGAYSVNGVPVRRFKVRRRNTPLFDAINAKLMRGGLVTPQEEQHFIAEMINSDDLYEFISKHRQEYVFLFIPYMFGTTYWGSRICPDRSFIMPCLHDEAYAHMSIFGDMLRSVQGLLLLSGPERDLARRLYGIPEEKLHLIGAGVDTDIEGNPGAFRAKYDIDGDFVLYAGRKDAGKNTPLLVEYFARYAAKNDHKLKLVLIGSGSVNIPRGSDKNIVDLPFVPQQDKYDAYSAALALCQPSLNESFSLVMMEAWGCGTPALVHSKCEVTRDHCHAANGGLFFGDFDEFEGCLNMLTENRALRDRLGQLGRKYVLANYSWPTIVERLATVLLGSRPQSPVQVGADCVVEHPANSSPSPAENTGHHMSEPMTEEEIEALYWQTVRSQEFYDAQYAAEWVDETPYKTIARMAVKYYEPRTVLDVGCGLGFVVKHLRKLGVSAFGLEFSHSFLSLSSAEARRFLTSGDVTSLPFPDNSFDLVICMEVLEHLPVRLVETAIQEMKRVSRSNVFVTIPSFGPNDLGPQGLPLNEPCWYNAAKAGKAFPNIVLDGHNKPDCGHITLATYRWWTETCLKHDLVRSGQLERLLNGDQSLGLARWHWNIYCLSKVACNSVRPSQQITLLGRGWTKLMDVADQGDREIRWTRGRAEVFLRPPSAEGALCVELYTGKRERVYDVAGCITLDQLAAEGHYQTRSRFAFALPTDTWHTIRSPLPQLSARPVRVAIELDEAWTIEESMFHVGEDRLGVGVARGWIE